MQLWEFTEVSKSQGEIALLLLPVMLVGSVWCCLLSVSEACTGQMLDGHGGRPDGPDGPGRIRRVRTGPDGSGRVDEWTDG